MKAVFRFLKRAVLLLLLVLLVYQLWLLGWVLWWKSHVPAETHFMSIRLDELRIKNPNAQLKYQWVAYEKISPNLKRAVIAAEDDKFMEHSGFDWDGMMDALQKNERRGKRVAGGSTITQQLAKNLFLTSKRSYFRKAEEAVVTLMLETLWDKRRILEVYLNVVEWGTGTFGAEAGAQRHFHHAAYSLSPEEAVQMAVLLPNPRKFEVRLPAYEERYAAQVLERMRYSEIPR